MAKNEDWKDEVSGALRREPWSLFGPTRPVKVIARRAVAPTQLGRYFCLEKSLLGRTPLQMESLLGSRAGELAGGCSVFRFKRLTTTQEVDYELTAKYPDGQAFNPAVHDHRYLPGSSAIHQWCLRVEIAVVPLVSLSPSERYPYLHGPDSRRSSAR